MNRKFLHIEAHQIPKHIRATLASLCDNNIGGSYSKKQMVTNITAFMGSSGDEVHIETLKSTARFDELLLLLKNPTFGGVISYANVDGLCFIFKLTPNEIIDITTKKLIEDLRL